MSSRMKGPNAIRSMDADVAGRFRIGIVAFVGAATVTATVLWVGGWSMRDVFGYFHIGNERARDLPKQEAVPPLPDRRAVVDAKESPKSIPGWNSSVSEKPLELIL